MTLILDFRGGISDFRPRREGLDVLLASKWDLHQNPGSRALGCETNSSTQHGRSFSHALNPQVARGDGRGLGVKAAAVIGHYYLQSRRRTSECDADRRSSRMPCYVGQGLLKNAIQT